MMNDVVDFDASSSLTSEVVQPSNTYPVDGVAVMVIFAPGAELSALELTEPPP